MGRVRVFLRTELFTTTAGHVPSGSSVLDGVVDEQTPSGWIMRVDAYSDGRGRALEGSPVRLFLPAAKIDHILLIEA